MPSVPGYCTVHLYDDRSIDQKRRAAPVLLYIIFFYILGVIIIRHLPGQEDNIDRERLCDMLTEEEYFHFNRKTSVIGVVTTTINLSYMTGRIC